jgi:basic membrane lipoprotein Med (substrate-binding protein (PBP1-ABC) superfamily)
MAGVTPVLREAGETVVVFQPGARPLWELAGAMDRAGFGSRANLLRQFEADPASLAETVKRPVVVIVDQFEELFTLAEPDAAVRFSELVATAIRDPRSRLRVVATLRADYYDKPLSMPALAGVFSDSVVSVKPMTPIEIESAVVEPARAAGVGVEPGLLAQVVADMGDEPGALPLLQFTLFELFEGASEGLMLADYQRLGGLNGALTGGADELLRDLDADGRDLAEQLMMRMVQKGRAMSTSRPVPLRDLLDLGVDRVALQDVLEAFGSRRLITFDRDASGAAVVEMAHEYLISQWPQLETWIVEHSEDLDRLYALDAATDEWLSADRSEDYLLRGERLDRFDAWRDRTSLRLTSTEAEFIDASVGLRQREDRDRLAWEAKEAALTRSARRRLVYFGGAVALLAAAVTALVFVLVPDPPPAVIVWYDGRGDASFGDMIAAGIDAAVEELDADVFEALGVAEAPAIENLLERGTGLILADLSKVLTDPERPARFPEARFAGIDCSPMLRFAEGILPNESCTLSQNVEVGFLAGVAAAGATETGRVGFIGGVSGFPVWAVIHEMHDGFFKGVEWVDPSIQIEAVFLSGNEGQYFSLGGFTSPVLAEIAANRIYGNGADVIFHAAGASGPGLFAEAAAFSQREGRHVWAIGVDIDQHKEIGGSKWTEISEDAVPVFQRHLLTSVLKRVDLGVVEAIRNYEATGDPGWPTLSIANGGVDYVTTGGHIDHLVPLLEEAKRAVIDGEVVLDPVDYERPVILLSDLLQDD